VQSFEVFSPLSMGSIKGLTDVTESRCIYVVMARGTNVEKLNADVLPDGPDFRAVRAYLQRLTLERFRDVADGVNTFQTPGFLVARERQLWRPLLILADLAGKEGLDYLAPAVVEMARQQSAERAHPPDELMALCEALEARLQGAEAVLVRPGDLAPDLQKALQRDYVPSPRWVGGLLKRNGFRQEPRTSAGVVYRVHRDAVQAIKRRYGTIN
jgi:hypothetical protein